jgi:hypothetical protein
MHRLASPDHWSPRLGLAALLATLASAGHAQAVQKCRIDGRTVFQSSPCAPEPRARPVVRASAAAPVPAGVAPKKKTLADLLRERDGADLAPGAPERRPDGANLLPPRMGAG